MRGFHTIIAFTIAVSAVSCSQPDTEPPSADNRETNSSNGDPTSPFADLISSPDDNTLATTLAMAEPNLETTGPVHESPGVVDNREARVALDLLKMENSEAKSLALTELFERWSKDDLNAAMEFLPYVEKDIETKRAFFRGVATELLEQDPERLLDITREHWWQGQWEATIKAMTKVADSNLDLAVDFYTNTVKGKQYPPTAGKIAGNLMKERSLEEAEAFALSLERPESRGMAVQGILSRWTAQDPVAASTYVEGISDPMLRDYAIRGMIQQAAGVSPLETLAWAKSMQEGAVRMNTVKFLARRWNSPDHRKNLEDLSTFRGLSNQEREIIQETLGN